MPLLILIVGAAAFPLLTAFGVGIVFPAVILIAVVFATAKLGMTKLMGLNEEPSPPSPAGKAWPDSNPGGFNALRDRDPYRCHACRPVGAQET